MEFDIKQARRPGFLRRMAALSYDLVLLFGVLMLAVAIVIIPYGLIVGEPFPHQETGFRLALQLYLVALIGGFYGFFWVHGGQTLGMRAWRFRLLREDGTGLQPRDALRRLGWAVVSLIPLGAGFLWMLIDRDGLAWHDRMSYTQPVMMKKRDDD
ncbi:MAG: RDD family protein [Pseudomonadota bacterium]|nr:RDD family protein [Pseudomonadota bacterium]